MAEPQTLAEEPMTDNVQSKIEREARRVASLAAAKSACKFWLIGTLVLGPLIFLSLVGGGGSNTGGVFPAGGIILVLLGFPLCLLLAVFALWYFTIEARVAKSRLEVAKEEASQISQPTPEDVADR